MGDGLNLYKIPIDFDSFSQILSICKSKLKLLSNSTPKNVQEFKKLTCELQSSMEAEVKSKFFLVIGRQSVLSTLIESLFELHHIVNLTSSELHVPSKLSK